MSHLTYSRQLPGGLLLAELIDDLIKAKEKYSRVRAMMDSVTDSAATLTAMEAPADTANFAIPAGKAANVYAAMNIFQAALDSIPASVLADLDLGG